ncbi:MAG: gliding motility lipoprotein GldH [Paramuribaculum sp.]|nr:gliding motility lipoprotein GldH [Paramuribaculum sp.]
MPIKPFVIAIFTTILTACSSAGYYSGFEDIDPDGWAYGDTISFTTDSCISSGMIIALRHNDSYPYKNIWIEISDSAHIDSVNIELCDIYGRWYGKGIGASYQIAAPVPFDITPNTRLNIRHILRVDTVKGIEQIGLIPQY